MKNKLTKRQTKLQTAAVVPTPKARRTASNFDPLGSYTGVSKDIYDEPVQDADDL